MGNFVVGFEHIESRSRDFLFTFPERKDQLK
jgi:hypothetical protein